MFCDLHWIKVTTTNWIEAYNTFLLCVLSTIRPDYLLSTETHLKGNKCTILMKMWKQFFNDICNSVFVGLLSTVKFGSFANSV